MKSWRKVKGEVYETWSSFTASIDVSKPSEPVEVRNEESGLSISGQRFRLQVGEISLCRCIELLAAVFGYGHQKCFATAYAYVREWQGAGDDSS